MTTLTLPLSDAEKEFIEAQVARGSHGDAVAYLRTLIDRDRARAARAQAAHRELVASLHEALAEEPVLMTPEDWADIRREARSLLVEREVAAGTDANEG